MTAKHPFLLAFIGGGVNESVLRENEDRT